MAQPSHGYASYDSLWKTLPEEVTLALVRTLLPTINAPLTPWRTDLAVVTDREIDGAFLVDVDGVPVLVHLEYQNYLDATIPRRMHEYASLLEQQYQQQQQADIDVVPIVIWAIPGKTPEPVYQRERFGKVLCRREYFELHLSELDWHDVDPLLLVLAPYLHGVQRDDLETIALQLYEATPPAQQVTILATFLALSERKFTNFAEIEQAILQKVRTQMNEILQAIEESSFGVAILEKGEARGKAEGRAEGRAEGKTEGFVLALQLVWQNLFGAMPAEVAAALRGLSETQLEELTTLFNKTSTEAEIRARLGL